MKKDYVTTNPIRAILVGLALAACHPDPATTPAAEAAVSAGFRYGMAEPARHRPSTEFTGSLDPVQSVQLGFDVPGRVQRLLVARGDHVAAGQAIAVLDSSIAQAQSDQAADRRAHV